MNLKVKIPDITQPLPKVLLGVNQRNAINIETIHKKLVKHLLTRPIEHEMAERAQWTKSR